jgi:hypothetical protein
MNEYRAALGVYDFPNEPEEITKELGIAPTKQVRRGETSEASGDREATENGWVFEQSSSTSMDEALDKLLSELMPNLEKVKRLNAKYKELSVVAYCEDANIGHHFDKKLLEILADAGIELDIDFYFLDEEDTGRM